MVEFSLRRGGW